MKKVGLALGSGAVRGLAHIGVLEVLERERVPVDMIAGTSAGAVVGALYAVGEEIEHIKELVADVSWRRLLPLVDVALPRTGFISGKKFKDFLKSIIGDRKFSDLKIPLACVATDIITGDEVVIDKGPVLDGVRASISLPVIFTAFMWNGRYLVDGGLVNPVPVSVLKRMGADIIIAVNVIPDPVSRIHQAEEFKKPNIISIIMQSIYIGSHLLVEASMRGADVVIQPRVAHIGAGDFHRAQDCIQQGMLAAKASIPGIKRFLED